MGYSDGAVVGWYGSFGGTFSNSCYSGTCQTALPRIGRSPNLLARFVLRLCEKSALRRMFRSNKEQVRTGVAEMTQSEIYNLFATRLF